MPLFQKSVLNKHLQEQNQLILNTSYNKFISNFADPEKQNNIRLAKEEQYQEGFLRELFVDVLGYTINPHINYNLTTEYKNEKDAKKADGALLKDNKPIAIIELKGTETVDLDTVEQQAFNYKNNQSECKYIITSNFERLRFYIENAIEFEEFDLFHLTAERFAILYLCLSKDNLLNDLPLIIKQTSVTREENITKQLYKDYSSFKSVLFTNIGELNPQFDKLLLYKKTQKLLDRFLFIFFAEDRSLLPPNSIREIIKQWEQLKELDNYIPLYDRFKKYFGYLKTGHKGKQYEIFAYNGGLFEPDEVLDNIKIDDQLLFSHTTRLADYDFETEVDVNILGHIFEHSLNDIEEVESELQGQSLEKNKSKRKKEGVYYTPKYITKYIVENTLGALCIVKKKELGIIEDEFTYAKRKEKRKILIKKLDIYRQWLLKLTICDPACGSGAFLNQALNFLIEEHKIIDALQALVTGSSIVFPDIENTILENSLYGVDLNDESIEIARLSLWLRTAQKGRKLTSLNKNIKCGNSLIDDPAIAGDKSFNWHMEFPEVFADGGFDVVVGNPPYVSHDRIDNKKFLENNYKCYSAFTDLYSFFYELGISIIKDKGHLFFITSNSFLKAEYGRNLRKLIKDYVIIKEIINVEETQIFGGAIVNTVLVHLVKDIANLSETSIIVNKTYQPQSEDFYSYIIHNLFICKQDYFTYDSWSLSKPEKENLKRKIESNWDSIEELKTQIRLGIATGDNNVFIIDENKRTELINEDSKNRDLIKPILRGRDIERYNYNFQNLYIILTRNEIDVIKEYPSIYKYFDAFNDKFKNRGAKGKHWTNLRACSFFDDFKLEKIVWIELSDKPRFTIVTEEIYLLNSAYFILPPQCVSTKYLLALLNSKTIAFYLKMIANTSGMGTTRWINIYVKEFPIPTINNKEQQLFIEKVDIMLSQNKQLKELQAKFLKLLSSKYSELKITNKLEDWAELEYKEFAKELEKQKIKLPLSDQAEWLDYFEKEKEKAQAIKKVINDTDREIDNMVYLLYGLTDEEIKIVEGA